MNRQNLYIGQYVVVGAEGRNVVAGPFLANKVEKTRTACGDLMPIGHGRRLTRTPGERCRAAKLLEIRRRCVKRAKYY